MNENKNAHKDIATTPRPQMAASGRLDFISFRIAQKSYTIYKMSPRTTARIMAARHIGKGSDGSKACIVAMAHSIALAVAGSKSIFADLKAQPAGDAFSASCQARYGWPVRCPP